MNTEYNNYCIIRLHKGKLVLCAYDHINNKAYQFDLSGNQTRYEYYDFTIDHYPDSDEIQNYLEQSKI